jgi:hypothetical protein
MKLLTKEIESVIPKIYSQDGKGDEAIVHVKFFTPDSNWTWYATEYDPQNRMFFGFVIGFEKEWGYFSLDELEKSTGPLGLPIERDLHFTPKPLREALEKD